MKKWWWPSNAVLTHPSTPTFFLWGDFCCSATISALLLQFLWNTTSHGSQKFALRSVLTAFKHIASSLLKLQGDSSFVVMTNYIMTEGQSMGTCPEVGEKALVLSLPASFLSSCASIFSKTSGSCISFQDYFCNWVIVRKLYSRKGLF